MLKCLFSVSYAGFRGQHRLDLRGAIARAGELGFDGVASYEMCSPLRGGGGEANLDACAKAYLAWMARNGY